MPLPHVFGATKTICKGGALIPVLVAINILPVVAAQKYGVLNDKELERGIKDHQGRHHH